MDFFPEDVRTPRNFDRNDEDEDVDMLIEPTQQSSAHSYYGDTPQAALMRYNRRLGQDSGRQGFGNHLQGPIQQQLGNHGRVFPPPPQGNPLQEPVQQYRRNPLQAPISPFHGRHLEGQRPPIPINVSERYGYGQIEQWMGTPDMQQKRVTGVFKMNGANTPSMSSRSMSSSPDHNRSGSYPALVYTASVQPPTPVGEALILHSPVPPQAELLKTSGAAYSRVQNNEKSGYGELLKGRPPYNVQFPLGENGKGIDIGMIEICTFFPSWFQIPDVAMRAISNGWKRQDVIKAQLHAVGILNGKNLEKGEAQLQKQISECGKLITGMLMSDKWNGNIMRGVKYDDLTAKDWQHKKYYDSSRRSITLGHIKLHDVYMRKDDNGQLVPLAHYPQGQDRLLLTECLAWAQSHPDLDLDTSHFNWIAKQIAYTPPAYLNSQHDKQARDRLRASVPTPDPPPKKERTPKRKPTTKIEPTEESESDGA